MRIGIVILPEHSWREAAPLWRAADHLGFDHIWTYDHLVRGGLPDHPWHSTVATLAAAATVTTLARLGVFVASPNFRHPALLAKEVTTLDDISDGRVLLGLGAGGDLDSQLLGADLSRGERTRRFEEFVPLLDRLLVEDRVSHEGEFYSIRDEVCRPPCVQSPRAPFVVAANGPRAMRVALDHGQGWVTTGVPGTAERGDDAWWEGVASLVRRLDEVERSHRDESEPRLDRYLSLDTSGRSVLTSVDRAQEQIARAEELGFTDVVLHWSRDHDPYRSDLSVIEDLMSHRP